MSQEKRAGVEVPNWFYYQLARWKIGRTVSKEINISRNGFENVPLFGGAMSVSNHRNNLWDVPILGQSLVGLRTPYYPAKIELNKGFKGRVLKGSGALFFKREDKRDGERLKQLMIQHLVKGHMLLTMVEGTSKNRGKDLVDVKRGALDVALEAKIDELILFGLAGTETDKIRPVVEDEDPAEVDDMMPTRVHVEVGRVSLLPLTADYRSQERHVPSNAQREYMKDVIIPTHQDIIDIAYEKVAA